MHVFDLVVNKGGGFGQKVGKVLIRILGGKHFFDGRLPTLVVDQHYNLGRLVRHLLDSFHSLLIVSSGVTKFTNRGEGARRLLHVYLSLHIQPHLLLDVSLDDDCLKQAFRDIHVLAQILGCIFISVRSFTHKETHIVLE